MILRIPNEIGVAASLNEIEDPIERGVAPLLNEMEDSNEIGAVTLLNEIENPFDVPDYQFQFLVDERYNVNFSDAFLWNALQSFCCLAAYAL